MHSDDQIDALWSAWDDTPDPARTRGLDRALIATVERLRAAERVPPPNPARMWAARAELIGAPLPAGVPPARVETRHASPARKQTRVLVVEREPILRRGLLALLDGAAGTAVAGAAATAWEGYRLADEQLPDVVLVGTTLGDGFGLAAAAEFRRRFPAIPTVVVSQTDSDDELFHAIRAGASAYCGQDVDEARLLELIARAARGDYVINEQLLERPSVATRVLEQFRGASPVDSAAKSMLAPLTDRELEILKKVSDGLTNAEIAFALGISAQTVKNHVTSILRKLAVNDRTRAVVIALQRGWIPLDNAASP